jgi:hypothetical protein
MNVMRTCLLVAIGCSTAAANSKSEFGRGAAALVGPEHSVAFERMEILHVNPGNLRPLLRPPVAAFVPQRSRPLDRPVPLPPPIPNIRILPLPTIESSRIKAVDVSKPGGPRVSPTPNVNKPGGPQALPTPMALAPGSYELQNNANTTDPSRRTTTPRRRRHRKHRRGRRVNPGKPGDPRKDNSSQESP